jgi:site-specific DNA-methyltransferase (cytosine-N4-specific)
MSRSNLLARWHSYKYFDYEKKLALREVQAQIGDVVDQLPQGLVIQPTRASKGSLQRLTYFQEFDGFNGAPVRTIQARLEGSVGLGRSGLPPRQQTRYSVHGIHEYKGKFNPQIVRAVANILSVDEGCSILDPFCGSGTSLVEAAYLGCHAVGLDLNPMAVLVANAKIAALHASPGSLHSSVRAIKKRLSKYAAELSHCEAISDQRLTRVVGEEWQASIPCYGYLSRWFSASVLCQLALIINAIDRLTDSKMRQLFLVILSDIIRDVSLQDPADLRIRRRKSPQPNYPAIHRFLAALEKRTATISAALSAVPVTNERQIAFRHDARLSMSSRVGLPKSGFHFVITSPPYATALPYIDTQRLSLCLLGLIDASEIANTERALIGSREINKRDRLEQEKSIAGNEARLPRNVALLCRELLSAATTGSHGFRRVNTPGLIYRYFADMKIMFESVARALRSGAGFALVVGPNRTSFGAERFVIDTPALLAELAASVGYKVKELINLDAYQRFGLHQKNGITSEQLVILKRASK